MKILSISIGALLALNDTCPDYTVEITSGEAKVLGVVTAVMQKVLER